MLSDAKWMLRILAIMAVAAVSAEIFFGWRPEIVPMNAFGWVIYGFSLGTTVVLAAIVRFWPNWKKPKNFVEDVLKKDATETDMISAKESWWDW